MIRDASIMLGCWVMLAIASGRPLVSALCVLAVGLFLTMRARVLLHILLADDDKSVLPLLNSPESDIAYLWHKKIHRWGRREKHLIDQLEQINKALSSVDRGFLLIGASNQIRWFNVGAERYLGLTPADVGKPLDHFLRDPAFSPMMGPINTNQIIVAPSPIDIDQTLEYNAFDDGESGKVIIVRDITRIRQLEQTRSDFASNVSHELKTPLTVIKGYSESLADFADQLPAPVTKAIKQIHQQSDRMQDIVQDLLWLNRLESTQLVDPTDLRPALILEQVREDALTLAQTLERQPSIEIEADEAGLNGNHREILTAFRNLAFNAVRYGQSDVNIQLVWRVRDDRCELMVKDDGPGIPRSHIRRVTERFYRVDSGRAREQGGTGLGLAIVKHVTERHDGKLRIRSLVGKGSEFICQFPVERVVRAPEARSLDDSI